MLVFNNNLTVPFPATSNSVRARQKSVSDHKILKSHIHDIGVEVYIRHSAFMNLYGELSRNRCAWNLISSV